MDTDNPQDTLLSLIMAVASDPKNPDNHIAMANFHANNECYSEAARCYRRALALDPDNNAARNNLGLCFHGMGKIEEAEKIFREILARDKEHAHAYENLGLILRTTGRNDEAITMLKECVKRKHHSPQAFFGLANIYRDKGQPQRAQYYAELFMSEAISGPNCNPEMLMAADELMESVTPTGGFPPPENN